MSASIDHFEEHATHAVYRPRGEVSVTEGINLMVEAIREARERRIDKLLIDITLLTGLTPPNIWQRARLGARSAEEARSSVIVAVVAPEELIDREKIGVTIARNRGILLDVFTSEQDALNWLTNPS